MKAAMIAVMSNGMLFSKARESESIARIMTDLNGPIFLKTEATMFTTMFLASLDTRNRELVFSNAGFDHPLLKSNGDIKILDSEILIN